MKNETKIIVGLIIALLISIACNAYFLGNNTDNSEQLKLYAKLSEQSDITTGLLQGSLDGAEKEIERLGGVSDKLREDIRTLQELNLRREQLDSVSSNLSGRIRAELVTGIQSIDSSTRQLEELERIELKERQSLGNILTGN